MGGDWICGAGWIGKLVLAVFLGGGGVVTVGGGLFRGTRVQHRRLGTVGGGWCWPFLGGGGFSAGGGGRFQEEVDFLLVEAAFFEGCGFSGGGFGAALFGSFGGGGVCGVGLRLV